MRQIFVVGTSGSGKSVLAKWISGNLGVNHIERDAVMWLPDWQKRNPDEEKSIILQQMQDPRGFVFDGNFLSLGITPPQESVLIFLDYSRAVVMSRIIRRTLRRAIFREKLWSGNVEDPKNMFSLDPDLNVILWSWTTHAKRRLNYEELIAGLEGVIVRRVRNNRDLKALKAELLS